MDIFARLSLSLCHTKSTSFSFQYVFLYFTACATQQRYIDVSVAFFTLVESLASVFKRACKLIVIIANHHVLDWREILYHDLIVLRQNVSYLFCK